MAEQALRIEQPGLLTSLQDWGRYGHLAQGIARGGPIDERAFLWGNRLLDNPATAAQLEVTLGGLVVTALSHSFWVVCGAPVEVQHNGQPQAIWQVFAVRPGDRVSITAPPRGLRCYLAVAGGLVATPVFGSVATVQRDALGGLHGNGKPLQAQDVVCSGSFAAQNVVANRRPQHQFIPRVPSSGPLKLGVLTVSQHPQFNADTRAAFFSQRYTVTAQQDRMGVRLKTDQPLSWPHGDMISEPLPIGAIQVPPDGQPIVMLNDCQTLGGYPKIGVLSWAGRMALAQAAAGTQITFFAMTVAAAQAEISEAYRFFKVTL